MNRLHLSRGRKRVSCKACGRVVEVNARTESGDGEIEWEKGAKVTLEDGGVTAVCADCNESTGRPDDNVLDAELCYPRSEGNADTVEVGLLDVRAADSIRIRYDFERDGWSVLQASTFSWESDDTECDMDWKEVAFIQAWQRERCDQPSVFDGDDFECGPLCPDCTEDGDNAR